MLQFLVERQAHVVPGSTCWWWLGPPDSSGYGYARVDGKRARAHRLSFEAFYGPIPDKLLVCHTCDNKLCVNPDHLKLGTHADNVQDAWDRVRKRKIDVEALEAIAFSTESSAAIARRLGVSASAVKKLRSALGACISLTQAP